VRIAKKVAIDIGRADLSSTLEYYSVIPDKWRDFPHHTGGRGTRRIVRRVLRARNNYIQGYDNKAAAELGVAFHYIADEHVLVRGSDHRHTSYESKISRARLNTQYIDSMEGKKATLGYITTKMSELSNRRYLLTPETALNTSYQICTSIAKSVFGSKTSSELQLILIELKKICIEKMKREEEEFVNKLIEAARKDKESENSEGMRKVANKIIKTLSFFDFRFSRNIKRYKERKHLENSVKSYYRQAALTSKPYKDWYAVETPELSIWTEEVKPKLLTVESVVKAFNLDKQRIKELEEEAKISILRFKDAEFVKREDVPKIVAEAKNKVEEYFKTSPVIKEPKIEAFVEPSELDLESLLRSFLDDGRLQRAKNIEDDELEIVKETDKLVEAAVREYHIVIDFEARTILHDCADWSKMLLTKTFCKHIGKLFLSLDKEKAASMLRKIYTQKDTWQFKTYSGTEEVHVQTLGSGRHE